MRCTGSFEKHGFPVLFVYIPI